MYAKFRNVYSGEGGIRTRGTLAGTHDFQSCTFGHSVTSPLVSLPCRRPNEEARYVAEGGPQSKRRYVALTRRVRSPAPPQTYSWTQKELKNRAKIARPQRTTPSGVGYTSSMKSAEM